MPFVTDGWTVGCWNAGTTDAARVEQQRWILLMSFGVFVRFLPCFPRTLHPGDKGPLLASVSQRTLLVGCGPKAFQHSEHAENSTWKTSVGARDGCARTWIEIYTTSTSDHAIQFHVTSSECHDPSHLFGAKENVAGTEMRRMWMVASEK